MSRDESRRSKRCRADRDYEMGPGTGIMVNDYDDERTLDEEEALEGSEDTHNELSHLQKESDMPLKDLLVMYGYGDMSCQDPNKAEDEDDDDEEEEDEEEEDDEDDDDDDPAIYEPDLKQFYTEMVKGEENGANVKRSSIKTGDPTRSGEGANLALNINAHTSPGSIDPKVEDDTDIAESVAGNSQLVGGVSDVGSVVENINNASGAPAVVNAGGGGGVGGGGGSSRLLRSVSRPQSEEEEDDCDYSPDEEEWKKTIMVGSDYQAAIPEGLCKYDDALPYENEDKMLWDPCHINEDAVEEFLDRAQLPVVKGTSLPSGSHVRDDEQALYLLLQCGYNLEEALRRRRMNVLPATESVSLWSEEECHNFETGLRNYGKDFHLIQKNKVRTRSVGELVQFYYLWKKTERHDIFTYKARLEKKKYALHPGITDYMDRFLEEQEGVRDRSSSPNVHCLLYGDAKRQRSSTNSANNDDQHSQSQQQQSKSAIDNWEGTGGNSTGSTGAGSGGEGPTSTPVNSGATDSIAVDHSLNSSLSLATAPGQLHYAKSSGTETNTAGAAANAISSTTAIATTITAASSLPSSSSSSITTAAPVAQQQQRNHLHHHHPQQAAIAMNHQQPPPSLSLSLSQSSSGNNPATLIDNNNDEDAEGSRSPENSLPHLPP